MPNKDVEVLIDMIRNAADHPEAWAETAKEFCRADGVPKNCRLEDIYTGFAMGFIQAFRVLDAIEETATE
jgi:hypothetical protein